MTWAVYSCIIVYDVTNKCPNSQNNQAFHQFEARHRSESLSPGINKNHFWKKYSKLIFIYFDCYRCFWCTFKMFLVVWVIWVAEPWERRLFNSLTLDRPLWYVSLFLTLFSLMPRYSRGYTWVLNIFWCHPWLIRVMTMENYLQLISHVPNTIQRYSDGRPGGVTTTPTWVGVCREGFKTLTLSQT